MKETPKRKTKDIIKECYNKHHWLIDDDDKLIRYIWENYGEHIRSGTITRACRAIRNKRKKKEELKNLKKQQGYSLEKNGTMW